MSIILGRMMADLVTSFVNAYACQLARDNAQLCRQVLYATISGRAALCILINSILG
jgi:hypothetical protein